MSGGKGIRTPLLDQFMAIKKKYPNAILFYRMGDFYEMFYDDAKIASEALGLRLTKRAHGKASQVPLAGFPYHQVDNYLTKMVKAGHRVVIVEQVEDPKLAKGLVKRDVVQIATTGTNPAIIDQAEAQSNTIAALIKDKTTWGLAWADITTGEFYTGEFDMQELKNIAGQIAPVEVLTPEGKLEPGVSLVASNGNPTQSKVENWIWEITFARQTLLDHFKTQNLKGFGIDHLPPAISAAGALLHYLKGNLRTGVGHFTNLSRADSSKYMVMEAAASRNLELVESLVGNRRATLFAVINKTITAAGRKLLYRRLLAPLMDVGEINRRLDAIDELARDTDLRAELRSLLRQAGDPQRFLARLGTGRASARDLAGIRDNLDILPQFAGILSTAGGKLLKSLQSEIQLLEDLKELLFNSIVQEPPISISHGGMIKNGCNAEIDELRTIRETGKNWLQTYEQEERQRTGISNLKAGFNKVFGYYLEITKSQLEKAPDDYMRRQTLVNAERYTSDALNEFEAKVSGAEEKVIDLERELFNDLVKRTLDYSKELQINANVLANLDFLTALAELAVEEDYRRPMLDNSDRIVLRDSRHPVVEKLLPPGEQFIPNDLEIGGDDKRILIITGPNMAGKSTYLRQVALTVILAQMGSFAPAAEARIGLVDKLFTRIGALDNLAGGESTFLVEMQETASILHNATNKSLVIFDEVGRGTSTFDGLSLAWAIVEYIHEVDKLQPRTLFATHFHELVEMEKHLNLVGNKNAAVKEYEDAIVFLRKIAPGGSDRSFGVHVAQMAGLPVEVISRAKEILNNLESNELKVLEDSNEEKKSDSVESGDPEPMEKKKPRRKTYPKAQKAQLTFFDPMEKKLREVLEDVDPDATTPMEALQIIAKMKEILK